MKLKKISFVLIVLGCSLFLYGCDKEVDKGNVTGVTHVEQTIVDEEFNERGSGTLKCSAEADAAEGIDVDLNYTVKYKNGNILELVSVQKVTSNNSESLDLYADAFFGIAKNYSGLKYYDTNIVRDSNTVTYTIEIDYDNIDLDKLLDIEGAEDNIVKNGKAKLSLWLDLAGQVGTVCEEA